MSLNENHKAIILVVEDLNEISENMNAMLTRKGHRVLNAKDAEGAIKIAEQSSPSMILTDLDLPTLTQLMDGLRTHNGLKHVPVAVIDIDEPQDVPADLTILKSFDELDALLAAHSHGDGAS